MANEEHVARLLAGVEGWNAWRRENPGVVPDLSGADLTGADLRSADLRLTNLQTATLQGAVLSHTNLYLVNLIDADLQRAILDGSMAHRALLRHANLSAAALRQVNLSEASLRGATFAHAHVGTSLFAAVDLGGVHGLETVCHTAPSTIGINTLYQSRGQIPEVFLRGCGVPDSMIAYARSLVAAERPIDYYSCFISYTHEDRALAERLYADLQAQGVRCWYAPHDQPIDGSLIDHPDQAIRLHEKLLLILSESSVASRWVGTEVKTAIMRERNEGRAVLFPIRLDDAVMQPAAGWARQVHERHIGDFRQWKEHDAYQAALARLLRDLKATPDR